MWTNTAFFRNAHSSLWGAVISLALSYENQNAPSLPRLLPHRLEVIRFDNYLRFQQPHRKKTSVDIGCTCSIPCDSCRADPITNAAGSKRHRLIQEGRLTIDTLLEFVFRAQVFAGLRHGPHPVSGCPIIDDLALMLCGAILTGLNGHIVAADNAKFRYMNSRNLPRDNQYPPTATTINSPTSTPGERPKRMSLGRYEILLSITIAHINATYERRCFDGYYVWNRLLARRQQHST